jgi:hypothetical protein
MERRLQELLGRADPAPFRDEGSEDGLWPEALLGFLKAFAGSRSGPGRPSLTVEPPPQGPDPPPYHALVRSEGPGLPDGGRRLYVRALLREHHKAFTSRLNKALTAAAPDRRDPSVRLALVRFAPKPSGEVTAEAVENFSRLGGLWLRPSDADLSLLAAAGALAAEVPRQRYVEWMRAFQPWRRLLFIAADLAWLAADGDED